MSGKKYLVLTGARNNAGDHLIRTRALALLSEIRPDREIIELDRSEPLVGERLELANACECIILTGGPGLRYDMYPGTYPLSPRLADIKTPIVTFGIGWKALNGDWRETERFKLSPATIGLLGRIDASGFISSVRDYHTLNVLSQKGFTSFKMTGCPAYFAPERAVPFKPAALGSIAFSAGVSMLQSAAMLEQAKDTLLGLRSAYPKANIQVAFHHSIDPHKAVELFHEKAETLLGFADWCRGQGFEARDISGGLEKMASLYSQCDLHIGYRVHAHILRMSLGRPSLLIAEDGRGLALGKVFNGTVLPGYGRYRTGLLISALTRIPGIKVERYAGSRNAAQAAVSLVKNQEEIGWPLVDQASRIILALRPAMEDFLRTLP